MIIRFVSGLCLDMRCFFFEMFDCVGGQMMRSLQLFCCCCCEKQVFVSLKLQPFLKASFHTKIIRKISSEKPTATFKFPLKLSPQKKFIIGKLLPAYKLKRSCLF